MERPSTSPHWGCTPWQELLLAVSLLTFWHLPITAQLTIKSEPFNATQGKDVLLSVYNVPVDVSGYQWYRGERVDRSQLILQYETNSQRVTEGPQYSGRKEIFSNGSLLLRNVRQEDSGFYTIHTITGIETDQASGQFRVFSELPKPFITSNNSHPMEDKDSVKLACEPETPDTTYRWWINGMSLPDSDRIVLTKDNRTLTLLSVTRTNKGPYGCETQNPVSTGRSDPITLDISYGPDPPTISPPDSNYPPGSNLSLSCHAASKPPAQYFWFLPRRPQQSTQVLFIPNIHKHDGGSYICLARNSATNLSRATIKNIVVIVSLLTFWHLPITAQLSIKSEPFNATQGKDVLLSVYNASVDVSGYQWYRGERVDKSQLILQYEMNSQKVTEGLQYSGREEIFSNGSLLLHNVSQDDAGFYTIQTVTGIETDQAIGQFRVFLELPKPFITSNNSDPMEGENSVTLTCEPETPDTTYRWWINGTSLPDSDRIALTKDNRTLTLLNVTRNDTGPYECETQNPVSTNRSDPVFLNVSSSPATQPLNHLHSNANDSGSYICLAHNSVTGLNRTTVKNITVLEPVPKPSLNISNTTVTEEDSVVLTCVSNYNGTFSTTWLKNNKSLVIIKDRMTLSPDNSILTIDPVKKEDEGEYQCAVSNSVSFNPSDPVKLYVRSNPKPDNGLSDGAIAGIVIGVLAGVALIAGLVYCLFFKKTRGASDQHHLTEHKPSDSNNSQGHSDNSLNKTDDVAYSSLNFDAQKSTQPTLSPSSTATETIYSEVKKK
ncbi:Carcinoembryonic antigen-related cell adhesion molecule 1 [Tupaia chinensis]|uniref:Carcinoembryonic antigen-related cell adhesion molecule 1 n=1 Tax=Tupaia chinensis TaxID=246437 RepID=L9L7I2_TUPCH|nr:Carcinoembryonic antigen-related cell adhesion molecule 1 [Tupaia chinensis]